jgi:two-component system nitrogen regulation response regulator NtrX
MAKILLVDDEVNIIKTISSILQDEDHTVYAFGNGTEALNFLKKNEVDLAILDIWLPDMEGTDILEKIRQSSPQTAVIMISGHGSIDIAVKSTRMGAFDFIQKPPSMERVLTSVNNAIEQVRLKRENIKLRSESQAEDEMIGSSGKMNEIKELINTAAATNARVFITGESGTGKELVARALYRASKRFDRPFIKVNCAAIPTELIESELFGHEKGAFTGAAARRIGKFEAADNGTLFLDEVCDMSQAAQAKVLRVLQEHQFERVGGNETISVDVRVISATNIDVTKAIADGEFREDLFYRLNVIPVELPGLRERSEDIPLIAEYYLNRFCIEHGVGEKLIAEDAMAVLTGYPWPGNVRELKNIMERLAVMVHGNMIQQSDVNKYLDSRPVPGKIHSGSMNLKKARDDFEKEFIVNALIHYGKNVTTTARELGMERSNLHRKINQFSIDVDSL